MSPLRGCPCFLRSPPPAGLRHDPPRNWAGIVHQRRPPRCRCRTTRRGDPCGRPPPNGATVRRPLPGHYRTGGVERRLSRGTMRPRRAPTRGAPTVIGNWKFLRSPPPPGLRHDPARNWGIVHQRRPPRYRCRTTRRGDPCGRPPPNGATVRRPLLGHYRTGGGGAATF